MPCVRDQQPPPHRKYAVVRSGFVFTATPCYGMHEPWWVVRLMDMPRSIYQNEAEPVAMRDDDLWLPIADAVSAIRGGPEDN